MTAAWPGPTHPSGPAGPGPSGPAGPNGPHPSGPAEPPLPRDGLFALALSLGEGVAIDSGRDGSAGERPSWPVSSRGGNREELARVVAADSEGRAGADPSPGAVPFTLPKPPPPKPFPPHPYPRP